MCIFNRPSPPPPPPQLPPPPPPPLPPKAPTPAPAPLDTDINPKVLENRVRKKPGSKKTNLDALRIDMKPQVNTTGTANTGGLNP